MHPRQLLLSSTSRQRRVQARRSQPRQAKGLGMTTRLTFDEKMKRAPWLRHWEAYKQQYGVVGAEDLPPSPTSVYESIYGAGSGGGPFNPFGGMF